MATALTLLPLPMKISAVEEREKSGQETEAVPETSPQESEPLRELKQETAGREETESVAETVSREETDPVKESEQETSAEEETEKREETETKEPPATTAASKETEPIKEREPPQKTEEEPEEGERKEDLPREKVSEIRKIIRSEVPAAAEIKVPIYNYDEVNIVAPAKYAVALNPYELAVRTGEDEISTEQVVSRNYGILNKSFVLEVFQELSLREKITS